MGKKPEENPLCAHQTKTRKVFSMATIINVPNSGTERLFQGKLVKMPIDILEDCVDLIKSGNVGQGFIVETINGSVEAKTRAQAINRMLDRVSSIDRFDTLRCVQRKDPSTQKIYIIIQKEK